MKKYLSMTLALLMILSFAGCSKDTRKMRGLYDEEDVKILADSLAYISFDEEGSSAEEFFGEEFADHMTGAGVTDYSQYPDDRTQGPFYQPNYKTAVYSSQKTDFPVSNVFAEYYSGELLSVTYTANHHYSMYESGDEGITPVKRRQQIVEAVEEELKEMGYIKYGDIDFYEDSDIATGIGFGNVNNAQLGIYGWYPTPDFTGSHFPYSLSSNKIPLYYSADGKYAAAVVPTTVCGNSDALMPYLEADKHERYAIVYIVMYDTEVLAAAREAGEVGLQNAYKAADAIENFRLIDDMGLDAYKEMIKSQDGE